MKKTAISTIFLLILSLSMLSASNVFTRTGQEKAERIARAMEKQTFEISITTILPQGAPSIQSSGEYSIRVKDGLSCGRLPFFGRSYTAVYGSDDSSVTLEDTPVTITRKKKRKAEVYIVVFKTDTPARWEGEITIWDSGNAEISCSSPNKSSMTYFGELDPDPRP